MLCFSGGLCKCLGGEGLAVGPLPRGPVAKPSVITTDPDDEQRHFLLT